MVVDEGNPSLSERELSTRELLIRLDERMANLSVKMDELRLDNSNKYEFLRDELKCSNEQHQKDIDKINNALVEQSKIHNQACIKVTSVLSMYKGALILLGVVLSAVTSVFGYTLFY